MLHVIDIDAMPPEDIAKLHFYKTAKGYHRWKITRHDRTIALCSKNYTDKEECRADATNAVNCEFV